MSEIINRASPVVVTSDPTVAKSLSFGPSRLAESEFLSLADAITDGFILYGIDGNVIHANSRSQAIVDRILDGTSSNEHSEAKYFSELWGEVRNRDNASPRFYFRASFAPDSEVQVSTLHLAEGVGVLLSQDHHANAQSSQFKRKFRKLLDSMGLAFGMYDRDLTIKYWSNRAEESYPLQQHVGKRLTDVANIESIILEGYAKVFETGEGWSITNHRPAQSDAPKSINITVLPLGDEIAVFYEDNVASERRARLMTRSEERFRRLSDSLSVALVMIGQDRRITYWNRRAEQLTGLPVSKAIGQPAQNIFRRVAPELIEQFVTALNENKPFSIDRMRYTDGRVNGIFSVEAFMVDDELALLIEDKTVQVRAEEQLRASEGRFRTLSENMSLALVLIDDRRKVTYWNRLCEITSGGIRAMDAIGKDAFEMLPMREETLEQLIAHAKANPEGVKRRVEPEREGVQGTYDIRAFAVGNEIAVLLEDVTLQVRQAVELDRSNHELLDLYHNAPCGYLSVLSNGEIERINQRMAEWLGYSADDAFINASISRILATESYEKFLQELGSSGLEVPLANLELKFLKKNGDTLWGLVNALPIFDPVQKYWYWRWTVVDVTELRAAQKQIEDTRLFTQLFNELGEAVLISDKEGKIVRANKAATKILGMSIAELTSLTHDSPVWRAVLDDGTPVPTQNLPAVRALREHRPVTNLEIGVIRPDGSLCWILESAAPLFDNDGQVTGVIVTFPEVTSTVQQRQTLKDLNDTLAIERDRANEANRLKSSFLANMSHEIRTPMTAILGFSDILSAELSGRVSEQHYTFLRSINVSGKRLLNLINDILDLSKIEAGRLELQSEELDVMVEIEAAVTPLAWIAKQKALEFHVEPMLDRLAIRGDRQRFGQVLTNIISNAIKFTRSGSITVKAGMGIDNQVEVAVTDTGIGISQEFLPHLFEEFRQEHTGVTREFGGTGLGLAISRRLVALMGGEISVKSDQGVGTTFTLTFPLASRLEGAPTRVQPAVFAAPKAPATPAEQKLSANKKHVLVVEDNIETQRLLDVYLKQQYKVSQAMNATEAMDIIKSNPPDFILMDVNLPGKDGLTITRDIRSGNICPQVPIVALTAFAMTGDRQRCIEAGCDDYLSKPATKREVLDIIERVMAEKA